MKIIPIFRLLTKVDKCFFFSIWLMFMVTQSQRVNGCLKKADNANETKIESFVGKAFDVRVNRNCNFIKSKFTESIAILKLRFKIFYNHRNM